MTQLDPPEDGPRGVATTALSGKGGPGKSFLTHHLASEASSQGKSVLMMDADPEANLTARFVENNPGLKDAPGLADVLIAAGILNGDDQFDYEAGAEKLREVIQSIDWPGVKFIPAGKQLLAISQVTLNGQNWQWLIREIFEEAGLYDEFDLLALDTAGRRAALVTMVMYACDVAFSPIGNTADSVLKAKQAKDRVLAIQGVHPLKWVGVVVTGLDMRAAANVDIRAQAFEEFGLLDNEGNIVGQGEVVLEIPYRPATVHEAYNNGKRLEEYKGQGAQDMSKLFRDFLKEHIFGSRSQVREVEA
ncbi:MULTISPECIES: ParA family protein [Actinomycetes]|uniref:ParA family protein n=1 Tax=Actinomycetes TaxID=1760 RepID=UPI0001DEE90D|nr:MULTISPECIES: ParA family protein [Actinomycetes]EFL12427.1 predicted protein [Streptomyces sp. AA4]